MSLPPTTMSGRRTTVADLVLAIDCSTSGSKAAVFNLDGRCIGAGKKTFGMSRPCVGWHEQDAEDWWTATVAAIREAVRGLDVARIASLAVTHQRETFVCVDAAGVQMRPAIVWADNRSTPQVAQYGSDAVHAVSGRPADITPSIYKIIWLQENEPHTVETAAHIGDVGAYLDFRLTGKWTSSWASADSLGLMNVVTKQWDPQLCALAGVSVDQLPVAVRPGSVLGELDVDIAAELTLAPGTLVVAGAGDGQCAALGTGARSATSMYLNIGTAIVAGYDASDYSWSRSYRTVLGAAGDGYLLETLQQAGTYLVTWFLDNFGPDAEDGRSREEAMEAEASLVPAGSDGLVALPYWNGAQTPHWDGRARGAVLGWTGSHGRAHFYRALLEGIAFDIDLGADGIEAQSGASITEFVVTGGGSRSALWCQILADVSGRDIRVCQETETTALGAAVLAATGAGLHSDPSSAAEKMSRTATVYSPRASEVALYAGMREGYRSIYKATRDLMVGFADATQP